MGRPPRSVRVVAREDTDYPVGSTPPGPPAFARVREKSVPCYRKRSGRAWRADPLSLTPPRRGKKFSGRTELAGCAEKGASFACDSPPRGLSVTAPGA